METILIVDDDKDFCFNLSDVLGAEGYDVVSAGDGGSALKAVGRDCPNLVLLDLKLPNMDGMKILEEMKKIDKDLIIIMLTAYSDVKETVKAIKLGAFDYVTKPFNNEELVFTIKKALKTQYLSREVERLRKKLGEKETIGIVMGESPQIKKVLKQVEIVAVTNMTVILEGESGTGKEVIANLIYQKSKRANKPFVPIDCGAIPESLVESELFGYEKGAFTGAEERKEGKFEQAQGGTLFLDEVANLPLAVQAKLLRVIEERKLQHLGGKKDINVNVRIIAATGTNLWEEVREGKFRNDLFHRLNEFCIDLPPLIERKEDVPVLAKCFLEEENQKLNKKIEEISPEAMKYLLAYNWPGNVRELKNAIRRAVLLADSTMISSDDLGLNNSTLDKSLQFQPDLDKGTSLWEMTKKATEQIEREAISRTLTKVSGNKTKAAKILKIDRTSLYSKIKEFQLE